MVGTQGVKNVEALKGLQGAEVRGRMELMKASLRALSLASPFRMPSHGSPGS